MIATNIVGMTESELIRHIQFMQRQQATFKARVKHELSELRLCLSGEPNIEMALDRVSNIEEAVKGQLP